LKKIGKAISSIHSRVSWLREKERERERNLNSLHHEILSPIDGILAHVEWMERLFERNGPMRPEDMSRIRLKFSDLKESSKLIDMLVTTMGRIDDDIELKLEDFSIAELLKTCNGYLVNEARRKSIQVDLEYLGLPKIKGDSLQLMRVFYNLVGNAIKYSDPRESKKYVRISGLEDKDHVVLLFSDNGIGVSRGEEEAIFQKFQRGSNAPKYFPQGTGLGLYYCRSILKKHGGTITVEHAGKPTAFRVKLPKRPGRDS
jgi:signal transduction histidine kinase